MCFLQHLFSLNKGKETKEFFNAYQVGAEALPMLSHCIFKLKEVDTVVPVWDIFSTILTLTK